MTIDDPTLAAVHRLWDELGQRPASDPENNLSALFSGVGDLIDSRHGCWLCAVRLSENDRDPLNGWRPASVVFHGELPNDQAAYRKAVSGVERGREQPDESTFAHVRQAGRFRASLLSDQVSEAFYQGRSYQLHYLGRGIIDRLFVILPVNEDLESFFMFDRLRGQAPFRRSDLEIAAYALRSLAWFNRQLHLGHGRLIAEEPLTAAERRVLKPLLGGGVEKAIADDLNQSPHTTHQHVKTIFRKFNVRSRAELMALWLGH